MKKTFDYIIVGAGSAGCVLANRLSENENCEVLLCEAGDEAPDRLSAPPAAALQLQNSPYDWAFETVPQKHLMDRTIAWPRGRTMGGSSVLNYSVYIRGNRGDFDNWAALGADGWDYNAVLDYFRKAETNATHRNAYHGDDGPLHVEDQRFRHDAICDAYFEAAQQAGIPYNADVNGAQQEGCGYFQATTRNGRRCSTMAAYLKPALQRSNLTVARCTQVTKVLVRNGRAVGVSSQMHDGSTREFMTDGEVIVAAGAIGSPHLLMLSGIGPADNLRKFGIAVAADLKGVGQNLQDHLGGFGIRVRIKDPQRHFPYRDLSFDALHASFRNTGQGPLATNNLEAGAFVKVTETAEHPDTQLFCVSGIPGDYRKEGENGDAHFYLASYVGRPKSRGSIELQAGDPRVPPSIDPNYLAESDDLADSIAGIRLNLEILAQSGFDALRTKGQYQFSGNPSDSDIEDFVRRNASTVWHPTSTCAIGRDKDAVVDPSLRVHGIAGLRVCDASVMPTVVTGNTNAATIMIAERGADLIKASCAGSTAAAA